MNGIILKKLCNLEESIKDIKKDVSMIKAMDANFMVIAAPKDSADYVKKLNSSTIIKTNVVDAVSILSFTSRCSGSIKITIKGQYKGKYNPAMYYITINGVQLLNASGSVGTYTSFENSANINIEDGTVITISVSGFNGETFELEEIYLSYNYEDITNGGLFQF